MFTRPLGLHDDGVAARLATSWGIEVDELTWRPVGFGSHHWFAREQERSWFVTVDDLDMRLMGERDDRTAARTRLDAALSTARALRVDGRRWVIAPVSSHTGAVTEPIGDRYVCAVYPFVDGTTSPNGDYDDPDERRAVVALLAELHRSDVPHDVGIRRDDHAIPRRDALEAAMGDLEQPWTTGPCAEPTRALLARHRRPVAELLERYDEFVDVVCDRTPRVVTHGEPHRGNVIITSEGPALIDWDTALLAPPERDLWSLIRDDPSTRGHYERRAESVLDDTALVLYRIWWDLAEIALYVHDFRRPHTRTDDTVTAWNGLAEHLNPARWGDVLERDDGD